MICRFYGVSLNCLQVIMEEPGRFFALLFFDAKISFASEVISLVKPSIPVSGDGRIS